MSETTLERLARAMCRELGYDYDTLYINKQDWTRDRGARHDINTPYQPDAVAAVRAILRELRPFLNLRGQSFIDHILNEDSNG